MSVQSKKLNPRKVETLTKPGRHSDGQGLYLVVDLSGARRWLYMFRHGGKLKEMGLGGYPGVTLANARERAQAAREVRATGLNPIEERRSERARKVQTFGDVADQYVEDLSPQWRSEKHIYQWRTTLTVDAAALRPVAIDAVTTDDVVGVLREIWTTKPETASRLRGRIERVLDAAKAKELRSGENPARWRGHLDHLLPKRQKLTRGHHAALPYTEMPAFMAELRKREGVAAQALELLILTATRTTEVREARWAEFDLAAKLWTVPAERMKAGKPHRVPLPEGAVQILTTLPDGGGLLFKGTSLRGNKATEEERSLSDGALERVLDRMKVQTTVHGFRSTFRDWAGETTDFPREVAEAALAHTVGDEVERAYRRGGRIRKAADAYGGLGALLRRSRGSKPIGRIDAAAFMRAPANRNEVSQPALRLTTPAVMKGLSLVLTETHFARYGEASEKSRSILRDQLSSDEAIIELVYSNFARIIATAMRRETIDLVCQKVENGSVALIDFLELSYRISKALRVLSPVDRACLIARDHETVAAYSQWVDDGRFTESRDLIELAEELEERISELDLEGVPVRRRGPRTSQVFDQAGHEIYACWQEATGCRAAGSMVYETSMRFLAEALRVMTRRPIESSRSVERGVFSATPFVDKYPGLDSTQASAYHCSIRASDYRRALTSGLRRAARG